MNVCNKKAIFYNKNFLYKYIGKTEDYYERSKNCITGLFQI